MQLQIWSAFVDTFKDHYIQEAEAQDMDDMFRAMTEAHRAEQEQVEETFNYDPL